MFLKVSIIMAVIEIQSLAYSSAFCF